MFYITIKVYHRHYEGDQHYDIETLYVNKTQLENWLKRGNTDYIEILSYGRA